MRNQFYIDYLVKLDPGLKKFVADQMLAHRGGFMAIPRRRLVGITASRHPEIKDIDRAVRKAIEDLRKDGWLIGMSQDGDGYFLITTPDEYEVFRSQYTDRAYKVIETAKKMDESARRVFASDDVRQLSLI